MSKKDLQKQIILLMQKDIDWVLRGSRQDITINLCRPVDVYNYLKKQKGFDKKYKFELSHNSWVWDFWCYFIVGGVKYILSGDGFYQNKMNFSVYVE